VVIGYSLDFGEIVLVRRFRHGRGRGSMPRACGCMRGIFYVHSPVNSNLQFCTRVAVERRMIDAADGLYYAWNRN